MSINLSIETAQCEVEIHFDCLNTAFDVVKAGGADALVVKMTMMHAER